MLVQPLINRGTPDSSLVLREGLLDVLNALRCSENTGNVDMFRIALGEESLHTHLHADTCGKHRVGNDEHLISKIRCGEVFDMYAHLSMLLVGILAISTHKGIARVVENIEETFVERKSGTEDRTDDNLFSRKINLRHTERCSHLSLFVIKSL